MCNMEEYYKYYMPDQRISGNDLPKLSQFFNSLNCTPHDKIKSIDIVTVDYIDEPLYLNYAEDKPLDEVPPIRTKRGKRITIIIED